MYVDTSYEALQLNRVYKLVWNAATGSFVVASELAKSHKKTVKRKKAMIAMATMLMGGSAGAVSATDICHSAEGREGSLDALGICAENDGVVAAFRSDIGVLAAYQAGGGSANGANSIVIGANATDQYSPSHVLGKAVGNAVIIGNNASTYSSADGSTGAVAIGDTAFAYASASVALGQNASAGHTGTVALGANATAEGLGSSTAVGYQASATGYSSLTVGSWANATQLNATALGSSANAIGSGATAVGYGAIAEGDGAVVVGESASASDISTTAIGQGSLAAAGNATAIGSLANATAAGTTALGVSSQATTEGATAIGHNTSASGNSSVAIGQYANAVGYASIAIGGSQAAATAAQATAVHAIAIGEAATASHDEAIAIGESSATDRAYSLSVGNSTLTRQITHVAEGTQATDAVNVRQLSSVTAALGGNASLDATTGLLDGPVYHLANGGAQTTIGGALTELDNAISHTAASGVQYDDSSSKTQVTLGGAGSTSPVRLTNVANGNVNTNSRDAINGSQLFGTAHSVTVALGGGSAVSTDGSITVPSYTLDGKPVAGGVEGAFINLDGRVIKNTNDIADLTTQLGDVAGGAVLYDDPATKRKVTLGGTGAVVPVALANVASGNVSARSTDAINGAQLFGTADSMVVALGGGSLVAPDGSITTPIYELNGESVAGGVEGAFSNLDGRVITNTNDIAGLRTQIGHVAAGAVLYDDPATKSQITLGGAGTTSPVKLTNVANGVDDSDAVTIAQLKAAGLIDANGKQLGALVYDDFTLSTATLGGMGGTLIDNLKGGLIAADSMQAVNGGQLFDLQENVQNQFDWLNNQVGDLNGRVGNIEQGIADGTIGRGDPVYGPRGGSGENSMEVGAGAGASGSYSTAIGNGSVASGDNSTAAGVGAVASGTGSTATGVSAVASASGSTAVGASSSASGENSVALGFNAKATGNNSVALGANSIADRDNTVSVGSDGNERQITHVAAATQRTDAANWGQVQDTVNNVTDWANQKFHQIDRRINRMGAMSAAYGQMAFSAQGLETKNRLGVGVGNQGGQSAVAIGYSRQLRPNVNLSFGGSASSSDVSVGVGLAVGW
ncbi:hypothetical protein GCM10010981_09350 [Dyella nitratireducens]|uniref:Head domain of trimeric autotransporter adhesin n=1 Tax=Dyella nitratireducens TaxID=1849580 RepID=A0ABQ1FMT4_9GAMM|nr:hypothetical protein GCM10010981_09350 [Dyella nitratireducens]GLQ44004.1 hypothetical protein GCM10007902_38540 [Dyella nitratireducens]